MLEIKYKRYYPKDFFNSNNEKLGIVSLSEQLSRAIIINTLNIDEEKIVQGDPQKKQPDYIFNKTNGLEVTFAATPFTIQSILDEQFNVEDIEHEIIKSILEACNRKKEKLIDGNYSNVKNTGLFLIELDPVFPWYQEYYGDINQTMYRKRDELFSKLYKDYIINDIFSDIYLLIITELQNYILFNIRDFSEKHDEPNEWVKEIEIINKKVLPYYKTTSFVQTEGSNIHYIIEDVIWF